MTAPDPPWALLAELTHACPLHCPYCSNPLELTKRSAELSTVEWARVFAEAAELGVVFAHLSGGEPLLRPDLAELVGAAESAGIYTQLVTSGLALTRARLESLIAAGLRSIQLSIQDATASSSDRIAGRAASFTAKERAAEVIREAGLPLGLNVVLHRQNLDRIEELIELGERWGAERIELANTQFYGWALRNRSALLPTRDQLERAEAVVAHARQRLSGRIELVWVVSDYYEGSPKPCMGGWGARSITVAPDGTALPCPAAYTLPLELPSVRDYSLAEIWLESKAFRAYRGTEWMSEPCRSCPKREVDFGGCRCQAFALTGDPARTDPVCRLSPDHGVVLEILAGNHTDELVYRRPRRRVDLHPGLSPAR
jgi:pyrroloquinoline quinone biosynthesis protein E